MNIDEILEKIDKAPLDEKRQIIIDVSRTLLQILKKEKYTEEDIKIIHEYVEKGLFKKSIEEAIIDTEVRKLILEIKYNYKLEIKKKEPSLKDFYQKNKMFKTLSNKMINILLDENILSELSIEEHDKLLSDFYGEVISIGNKYSFKFIELFRKRISVKDFEKTNTFSKLIDGLKKINKNILNNGEISNYFSFIKDYVSEASFSGVDIDFENNELVKQCTEEQLEILKGLQILGKSERNSDISFDELEQINLAFLDILEKTLNSLNYVLTEKDKNIIKNYFKNYYKDTLANCTNSQLKNSQKVLEYLVNISTNSLQNIQTNLFIKQFYANDLTNDLEDVVKQSGNNTEFPLTLLSRNSTKYTEQIENYISSKELNGEDVYKSELVSTYIESFITNIMNRKEETEESFQLFKKYIDGITKREDFDIFNEQYVSDTLQLLYTHRFSNDRETEIQEILERNCQISQIDVKKESQILLDFIENNYGKIITEGSKMDEFSKHLGNLKLADYRIYNQDILNFVIQQALDKNSIISKNPEKYLGLVGRCIEDFARNDLAGKINQENYVYFIREDIGLKRAIGKHIADTCIYFKKSKLIDLIKYSSLSIISNVFHENTHASQNYDIKVSKYSSYYKYLMIKEDVIKNYDCNFYNVNYSNMFEEVEARLIAAKKTGQLLEKICPDTAVELALHDIKDTILFETREDVEIEMQNYEKSMYKIDTSSYYRIDKIEDIFDKIIAKNPEYLEKYPGLNIEYNSDGSLKTIRDMLPNIDSPGSKAVFFKILKYGNCFKPENLSDDIKSIMEYDIQNKRGIYSIALIISDNIPRMISQFNKIPKEKLPELYYLIIYIQEKIDDIQNKPKDKLSYSEIAFFKGMTRENSEFSKNALSMLGEVKEKIEEMDIDLDSYLEENIEAGYTFYIPEPIMSDEENIKSENGFIDLEPPTISDEPKEVRLMFEAYYSSDEILQNNVMSELVNLGINDKTNTKLINTDKAKKDKNSLREQ